MIVTAWSVRCDAGRYGGTLSIEGTTRHEHGTAGRRNTASTEAPFPA